MTELMAWQAAAITVAVAAIIVNIWFSSQLSVIRAAHQKNVETALGFHERLSRISALETPKGSATSKKMARIARGESDGKI